MFDNLFGDETSAWPSSDMGSDETPQMSQVGVTASDPAPPPRPDHGLCGLSNQGNTCYLNSLLQTLALTPEFRESLFTLNENDLGSLKDAKTPGAKVRVIPLQLQRVFARLLLLNALSIGTDDLTSSFGWTSEQVRDQHDVQELNRILFTAIEESLVGTPGAYIIRNLYHGTIVNQIQCEECGLNSKREEDFLDLSVAVTDCTGLEDSLSSAFIHKEFLRDANMYNCSNCNRLTNANKGARIQRLPSLLTLSLLRFNYSTVDYKRYKETGKFTFPIELDMRPYCENVDPGKCTEYELYSIVIHRGDADRGHYHAYIRDIDNIGSWTRKAEEKIYLPEVNPSTGKMDVIPLDSPEKLIRALLERAPGGGSRGLTLNNLCEAISKETESSWAKLYRLSHGPIIAFLKARTASFTFNPESLRVTITKSVGGNKHCTGASVTSVNNNAEKLTNANNSNSRASESGAKLSMDQDQIMANNFEEIEMPQDVFVGEPSVPTTDHYDNVGSTAMTFDSETRSLNVNLGSGGFDSLSIDNSAATSRTDLPTYGSLFSDANDAGKERELAREVNKHIRTKENAERSQSPIPASHKCWFDFNDTRIHPVKESDIATQFEGKESAYMLFYRMKSLVRPVEADGNAEYGIPDSLRQDVVNDNITNELKRRLYDSRVNTITVEVHFGSCYVFRDGALHPRCEGPASSKTKVNKRDSISDLLRTLKEQFPASINNEDNTINIARDLPAGVHLYEKITEDLNSCLAAYNLDKNCQLFIWNGYTVNNYELSTGADCEPVLLEVSVPGGFPNRFSCGYPQSLTIQELKESICARTRLIPDTTQLRKILDHSADAASSDGFPNYTLFDDCTITIKEFGLQNCDQLLCVDLTMEHEELSPPGVSAGPPMTPSILKTTPARQMVLYVENRCSPASAADIYPEVSVEVDTKMTVKELKAVVLTAVVVSPDTPTRLKIGSREVTGLASRETINRPPLHEHENLETVGLKEGNCLILEPGHPPSVNQVSLFTSLIVNDKLTSSHELTVEKDLRVSALLHLAVQTTLRYGDEWHLRRTDWCGEPSGMLDDLDATVEGSRLKHGDTVTLQAGRLPPKGSVSLSLHLIGSEKPCPLSPLIPDPLDECGYVVKAFRSTNECLPPLATIVVSKSLTLRDLKELIMNLDALSNYNILSSGYIRLRLMMNRRPTTVLRLHSMTLQKLKLFNGCNIGFQILTEEENLSINELLLLLQLRVTSCDGPDPRSYLDPVEVKWEISQGASLASLSKLVKDSLGLTSGGEMLLAKHIPDKFEWMMLNDSHGKEQFSTPSPNKNKKKKSGSGSKSPGNKPIKVDLRHTPFFLQDGDVIGVKMYTSELTGVREDFGTAEDDEGKRHKLAEKEMLLKVRKQELRRRNALSEDGATTPQRRPEPSIKIHVDDFR